MSQLRHFLLVAASAFAASPTAFAGDYIVRVEALVASVAGAGASTAPFSSAQFGDRITIDYSLFYPGASTPNALFVNGQPIPGIDYQIDYTSSSVTFGGQNLPLVDTVPPPYEDGVSFVSGVNGCFSYAGVGSGFLLLSAWDPTQPGGLIPSDDLMALVGTNFDASQLIFPILSYTEVFGVTTDEVAYRVTRISVLDQGAQIGTSYCTALANSTGAAATISASGSTAVAQNDLQLQSSGLPPSAFGLFIYGPSQIQTPFGDGFRCVGGQLRRLQASTPASPAGVATLQVDLNSAAASAIVAGSTLNFQYWYRDAIGGPSGFNTTNAVAVSFQ
jgi:hypothetical protein